MKISNHMYSFTNNYCLFENYLCVSSIIQMFTITLYRFSKYKWCIWEKEKPESYFDEINLSDICYIKKFRKCVIIIYIYKYNTHHTLEMMFLRLQPWRITKIDVFKTLVTKVRDFLFILTKTISHFATINKVIHEKMEE